MKTAATALKAIDRVITAGPFAPTWEALEEYGIPRWYKDDKFGIFIHWGVYAVPAFCNEWYPRLMYLQDQASFAHHRATWGDQKTFGYKDFIPRFKAEAYDPAAWAELFAAAGARFVVPVAEHHDGFAMYDSGFSRWCAAKMGPRRDLIGDLAEAVRRRGMTFGVSSHRAEHWWFMDGGRAFDSDVQDERYRDFYGPARPASEPPDQAWLDDWLVRTCELVDKYQPQIVWFDWWIEQPVFEPYLRRFAAYYYNRSVKWRKGVAINYKNQSYPMDCAVFDVERGQLSGIRPLLWQTDTAVAKNSWGYIDGLDYKEPGSIVHDLVDIVSKNGALLLNIGPRADGTIPEPDQRILREIGAWLKVNGDALYSTRPWRVFGEGPTQVVEGTFNDVKRAGFTAQDIRFTRRGDVLYAIALGWPADGILRIRTLKTASAQAPARIGQVELLGHGPLTGWTRDAEGLTVPLPAEKPCAHAFALRLTA